MRRSRAALVLAFALIAGACAARGNHTASNNDESSQATTTTAANTSRRFGTIASPCGPDVDGKKITLDAAEAGKGTDKLYIGVANDRTAEARPGLLKEMYDSTLAFAKWCNAQGGIGGLQVEPIDLDGQLFNIEAAMTTACSSVFAMVGGAYAQDNLVFTGKDGSDFHKCKMIAFPGFAVSVGFADANGVVQPLPVHGYERGTAALEALAKLHPDQIKKVTSIYGDGLDSLRVNKDQNKEMMKATGGYGFVDDITYKLLNNDFSVTAQKVIDVGATMEYYVGEPENWAALLSDLKTKGYKGIDFAETNEYDPKLFSKGPEAADGAMFRLTVHPFEEATKWPATQQFLDIMKQYGPADAKVASLGAQSFSAGLLFATAVNECAKSSGGAVTRACVVKAGESITSWTGGGLHAKFDPSGKSTEDCASIFGAKNGTFVREFPKLGSKDDNGDGFFCDPRGVVQIQGDFGKGNVDSSLPY
jgi:ABC-type branched-subunit amino acid transport system substrate-binding protein